ncbi:hypothetical protein AVEN_209447-1 [Araneus ventricosus]|uniref:Uncharacterized protein n=1 Tax=Araneus ventricosus TaxID=182803 RepID=A0A4Y2M7J6_ARAVE|nr:hypothetical protein AVEN_209447-1 [Araneus ventricosus]
MFDKSVPSIFSTLLIFNQQIRNFRVSVRKDLLFLPHLHPKEDCDRGTFREKKGSGINHSFQRPGLLTEKKHSSKPDPAERQRFGVAAITSPCRSAFSRKQKKGTSWIAANSSISEPWIGRYILIKYLSLSLEATRNGSVISLFFSVDLRRSSSRALFPRL